MTNLTDTATYDAGVYQIATTDAVQGGAGGIANKAAQNLANRTAYLKAQVDALNTTTSGLAPIASPAFSGSPTAPTPALSDRSTKLANTNFAHAVIDGVAAKDVSGASNVTLTVDEAANGILDLYGTITANIAVLVPATSKSWIVRNRTGGAFTVTVRTAAGGGINVAQNKTRELWCDATNVLESSNDFTSPALTGSPTAPTPATADSSTLVATTAFTQAAVGSAIAATSTGWSTGDVKATLKAAADSGWIMMDDGTVGDGSSGASTRANADCQALFTLLWNNIADANCPVVGGRGASAAVDWAAHKKITLPKTLGRALAFAGSGASLSARTLAAAVGEEAHTLTTGEMPSHSHTGATVAGGAHAHGGTTTANGAHSHGSVPLTTPDVDRGASGGASSFSLDDFGQTDVQGTHNHNISTDTHAGHQHGITSEGGGAAHNNMQPSVFMNFMVKL